MLTRAVGRAGSRMRAAWRRRPVLLPWRWITLAMYLFETDPSRRAVGGVVRNVRRALAAAGVVAGLLYLATLADAALRR